MIRKLRQTESHGVLLYVTALICGATTLGLGLFASGYRLESPWAVLALALTAAVAERWRVPLSATTGLSVYLLSTVVAAVVLGPLAAALVGSAAMLGDPELIQPGRGRSPRLKWATYTSTGFLVGGIAGLSAEFIRSIVPGETASLIAIGFGSMAVAETLDFGFAALTGKIRGRPFSSVTRAIGPVALTSFLVFTPAVVALSVAYEQISPWTIPLFLGPALAFQRLYGLYQRERELAENLTSVNAVLARANLSFAEALVATLDARDQYTAGHSAAVAIYSRDIAKRMGLPPETCERAYLCGLVHDIGKIGLPPGLLEKPGALTLDERKQMQEHSAIGERILRNVDGYDDIASIVRHHHERVDGEGYPDGLKGEGIPVVSRIIAVADAYNAMTSNRPYRDAMPSRVARLRLAQAVETQFDTAAVAAFEAILAAAEEDYRMALREDFGFFSEEPQRLEIPEHAVEADAA